MSNDVAELGDLPELRMFDSKATRGAVVRGVLRTALIALGLFVGANIAAGLATDLAMAVRGSHDLERLGSYAFDVGHPGLTSGNGGSSSSGTDWFKYVREEPRHVRQADGNGASVSIAFSQSILGRLHVTSAPETPVDRALDGGRASPKQAHEFVAGLPKSAVVDAVVELAHLLTPDDVIALLNKYSPQSVGNAVGFYGDPFPRAQSRLPYDRPVSSRLVSTSRFFDWARSLKAGDDGALRRQRLPSSREIRALADSGTLSAVLVTSQPPEILSALLADPAIRSLTPASVGFTILDRSL